MKLCEELQSLTYHKERLLLPHDKEHRTKGTMFYTLNMSNDSIMTLLNDHPVVSNNGTLYNAYYYDYTILPKCIQSSRIINSGLKVSNARKDRISDYDIIQSKIDGIKTPINLSTLADKNFIYDLAPVIRLYENQKKLKNLFFKEKLFAYFNTINYVVNKPIEGYNKSFIFVDLDEYHLYKDNKDSHILYNLVLLLRRSNKIIESLTGMDFSILFYTKNGYFTFDMKNDVKKTNLAVLNRLVKRIKAEISIDSDVETAEKKEVQKYLALNSIKNNFTGDDEDVEVNPDEIIDKDDSTVTKIAKSVDDVADIDELNEAEEEIFKSDDNKKAYIKAITNKATGTKTEASLKRDQMLREKQLDLKINGKTIKQLQKEKDIPVIAEHKVTKVPTTNENIKNVKFVNFEKTYMDTLYDRDISNVITCLNDKSIPVTILDIKVEDTSDALNMKETYTVTMEDEYRKRHTLKFALPKLIDNKFMYINGNKKSIQKQIYAYPVIKTGPDEVQIVSNYNKIFIRRYGDKLSRNTEKFRKLLADKDIMTTVHKGSNLDGNKDYLTCLEYDELSKEYNIIKVGNATFVFNAKELHDTFDGKEKSDGTKYLVGYTGSTKKTPIYYDTKSADTQDLVSLMVSYGSPEAIEKYNSYSTGKKFMHTKATIMAKKIPVIVLLSFFEGLDKVVRKFNDSSVVFSDKKDKGDNYQYIKFADGFLCYPLSNMEACMLFNGFTEFNTSAYTLNDMNDRVTYLEIFEILCGTSYIANALINYYDFMIDPITLEILQLLNYPTDLVELIIFANNMLADTHFTNDIEFGQYRLRDNEIIPAILYGNIARAYSRYRTTANNPNPIKITMDENAVIKEMMALPTVEDYSTLSPMVEMHKYGLASMKGFHGMNLDRAYKSDKRAYDDSMIGVVGMSTDIASSCGMIRQLVTEPKVINARGFMDITDMKNVNKLTDVNLATPIEMMTPGSCTHDDPQRNAMATKQTTHIIPVEQNCPVLVSTGMDQIVHYQTANDFSVVASENGKVVELDEKTQMMIVKYKSGKTQAVDLTPHVVKNGGGGFYLANKLSPRFKKGDSFEKDDILAYDPKYYKEQNQLGNRLTMGSLVKVAIMSNFSTYEDSTGVTKNMSRQMATNITMPKSIIIGANSNVDYIVKPGDSITIGDDLIRYETSYDDSELNRLLSNVRADMKEEIINLGKSKLTSSYTGKVEAIDVYCTVDLDELSPSLKKIVSAYQNNVKAKKKLLDKYDTESNKDAVYRMGVLMNKPYDKVKPDEYGKIKGQNVGRGVLIEFFITYHDELSDGDKLSAFTANKNTIGYVIPEGYEPYSEFRPYEEISTFVAPSAILQRGTPSIVPTGCAYKVLIELKRKMYEILTGENYDEVLKQKQPWMNHDVVDVKESTTPSIDITNDQMSLFESTFDLYQSQEGYQSSKYFLNDDIILSVPSDINMSSMLEHFCIVDEDYNAIYDVERGFIVATEDIKPNTNIRLKL